MRDLGLFQLWVTVHVVAVAIHYRYVRGAKGYGILAVLVWNRVSILTILVWNRVWFVHSRLELGMFFEEATSSSLRDKTISLLMFILKI